MHLKISSAEWQLFSLCLNVLSHWGRVTHIYVSKLAIIGSDNDLSPGQRQAIIWTNDGILLIRHLGTKFNETSIKIHAFSFKKIHLKMSSQKWQPFCPGGDDLNISVWAPHSMFSGRAWLQGNGWAGVMGVRAMYEVSAIRYGEIRCGPGVCRYMQN